MVDLASERLGGRVLFANDDFFAEKENLLKAEDAIFIADEYTDRGKWMDGWESRRRRTSGHDFAVVQLGLPGSIRGFDVDTSHFTGNYPEACSIDAISIPEGTKLDGDSAAWVEVLPRTPLRGGSHNLFPLNDRRRFTHVRLQIYPDGGVARLRVHGEAMADWRALSTETAVDLCTLGNGGLVMASSDAYFGSHQNLLMPGQGTSMKDGWETKRSRRPGA
ncbi:MAG: allantoicase, partial [Thermoanaerobaculia bacterium]